MKNIFNLQKKIGLTLSIFCFLILVLRLAIYQFDDIFITSMIFLMFILFLLTFFINNKYIRLLQVMLFIIQAFISMLVDTMDFFSYWIALNAIIIFIKYDYLKTYRWLKTILIIIVMETLVLISLYIKHQPLVLMVPFNLFLMTSLVFLYFFFEEDILNLKKEKTDKENEIKKLVPIKILGERTAMIIHSFKNLFSSIKISLALMEEGIEVKEGIERLKLIMAEFDKRINTLLSISRTTSTEKEIVNISELLEGINLILLKEKIFLNNAKIDIHIEPNIYKEVVKIDVIMMFENIFKNAIEAIIDRKIYGNIIIRLSEEKIFISNDGGCIERCYNCDNISCFDCVKFPEFGKTTKENGSGHGMKQIFNTVKESGWDLKINCLNDITEINVFFNKKEKYE